MSEMGFWFITVLILLGSAALFILPMLKGKEVNDQNSRDELNKAFFYDRMAEIKKEARDGLVKDSDEIALELQQSLLDDIPKEQAQTKQSSSVSWLAILPGVFVLFALSYALYFKFGNLDKVKDWQNVASRLPELSSLLNKEEGLSEQEMQDLKLALRTQLMKTPDEAMGWLLLGRLGLASRDVMTTEGAMDKAYKLDPNHPEIKLGFAQAMMLSGEENKANKAKVLLREILETDANNIQALSLLAFDAFEHGDFNTAISLWSRMSSSLSADDPRQVMLSRSIERAQASLNPNQANQSLNLTITLDEQVVLPEQAVLLVSVYDEANQTLPIAAKLVPLSDFPMTVQITDADSMLQSRLVSSLSTAIVKARIDSDGDVMTKEGDWGSESLALKIGENANIVINQKL